MYDQYNYACWLTIHWFDLYTSETKFPDVYNFLSKGNFSFQKSHREFSRIGLDQIHEQNNKLIKGCGGASKLPNKVDNSALICWETCSPEIVRVLSLKIVSIEMKFLPSRVPSTMKVANLFTKDSLPTFIDLLNALQ